MESQLNTIEGVDASINFMTKKLELNLDPDKVDMGQIVSEATKIIQNIEDHVKLVDVNQVSESSLNSHDNVHSHGNANEDNTIRKTIYKIVISLGLFALALILNGPNILKLGIFLVSYIIIGGDVLKTAYRNIKRGQVFDENFLMTIATIGAFLVGEYPEGVAVMLFYQMGELFQDIAVDRSRRSISDLMDIRPDYANLKFNDELITVSPENVKVGDIIIVKPGEKVPLDGVVIEGSSMVDTSALTGESVPRQLEQGDQALSGFINNNGVLTIEVKKEFGESTVTKILELVQNASSKKAETEKFITKFARYYTPAVVYAALAIAIIPPIFLPDAKFFDWFYRALIFLVISCPCALVISIPLGFFGGIGGASKKGILIKGSNYLEALYDVELVVFDKTGTLTKGVFKVTEINPVDGISKEDLIRWTGYGEKFSNHPIGKSIISFYDKEIDNTKIEDYEEISGNGVRAIVEGREIIAGNSRLMNSKDIKYKEVESIGTVLYVAIDGKFAGSIVISDEIKDDAINAIKDLKALGVRKTIMLTGDKKAVGEMVAYKLGIDEVYTELLPTDKVDMIERISLEKSPNGKLVFVGDGINDAPVLARADIGMAMGALGSDAAIEAADIVIMTDEPSKIATSIRLAKQTRTIVWQNIVFALGVKAIFLLMGFFGIATMWEAVFADVGVAIIAILNSMRVMNVKDI